MTNKAFKNQEHRVAVAWTWITLILFALCFLPSAVGMDMMRAGFGIIFISAFATIMGLIVVFLYRSRAAKLDAMVNGKDLLVHWTVDADVWRDYVASEFVIEKSEKKALFLVTAVISVAVGVLFMVFARDGGVAVFLILMGLVAILAVVALLGPRLRYRRALRSPGEIFISPSAAYVGGALHTWTLLGAKLERVDLADGQPQMLEIEYSFPTRMGRDEFTLRIPVPAGRGNEAAVVAEALRKQP
jgi:hypothetical protein